MMKIDRVLLVLFLLSAALGVWIAYDRVSAIQKFGVLTTAVALFAVIRLQPKRRSSFLSISMIAISGLLGTYFMMSHDWMKWPADFRIINDLLVRWMTIRPDLKLQPIHPNIVGGTLAFLLPFALAEICHSWRTHEHKSLFSLLIALLFITLALLFTSSRAAWVAFTLSLIFVTVFWLAKSDSSLKLLGICLGSLIMLIIATAAITNLSVQRVSHLMSGVDSRIEVIQNSMYLARDFMITGGGLAAFPGLYSHYMLVIPYLFLEYSHNLYLDLLIEQGMLGLISFVALMFLSMWRLGKRISGSGQLDRDGLLSLATLAGLLVISLHGLIDDPLYAGHGSPLMFLLIGWEGFLNAGSFEGTSPLKAKAHLASHRFAWGAGLVVTIMLILTIQYRNIAAAFYASGGAVRMAQIDLQVWPEKHTGWYRRTYPSELVDKFDKAIKLKPDQFTARYRLGLIELNDGYTEQAVAHLEKAYQVSPHHRGVVKNLGYAYVWRGDLDVAMALLKEIPEASEELSVYEWWWGAQGEARLAELSGLAASALQRND
jgi:hypothetical protein